MKHYLPYIHFLCVFANTEQSVGRGKQTVRPLGNWIDNGQTEKKIEKITNHSVEGPL